MPTTDTRCLRLSLWLFGALLAAASPLRAQQETRVREIARVVWDGAPVLVQATDRAFGAVTIRAVQGINRVDIWADADVAFEWARMADSLVSHPHRALAGELLRVESRELGPLGGVQIIKLVRGANTSFRIVLHDRHAINVVSIEAGPQRARAFISAVRAAARAHSEMTGQAISSPASPGAPMVGTYELSAVEEQPSISNPQELVRQLERTYPPLLRDAGVVGTVQMRFRVLENGTVDVPSIQVTSSTHEGFNDASIRSVQRLRFRPAKVNNRPVKVWVELPIQWPPAQ